MVQNLAFWLLLLCCPLVFWQLPAGYRFYFLAFVSVAYIFYLDPASVLLLLSLGGGLYLLLPVIARGDQVGLVALLTALLFLIGSIVYEKYLPLILANIMSGLATPADLIVPLGMSYYIFKMIHVAVDSYRDRSFAVRPGPFFCYLFLFTIFSAGPIQRLDLFLAERQVDFDSDLLVEGFTRIAFGFAKQFFVIDLLILELRYWLVPVAETPMNFPDHLDLSTSQLWLKLLFIYLIGYLNFSAYTDIAIGASRLFGFTISENFNFPIIARSIGEFWRRWHMTLAAWAQTYVYSPLLAVTRNPYVAIYASFAVIGLWHAGTLNRLAWGLFHASGVLVAARWARYARSRDLPAPTSAPRQALGWILTQGFVVASMVFVIGEFDNDILTSIRLLTRLVGLNL